MPKDTTSRHWWYSKSWPCDQISGILRTELTVLPITKRSHDNLKSVQSHWVKITWNLATNTAINEPSHKNRALGFLTKSYTNWTVLPQMVRSLKIGTKVLNFGQLICIHLTFHVYKNSFSHDTSKSWLLSTTSNHETHPSMTENCWLGRKSSTQTIKVISILVSIAEFWF